MNLNPHFLRVPFEAHVSDLFKRCPLTVLTGTNSSISGPLPGTVRFKGRGRGGGKGSGLGAVCGGTIGREGESRSVVTGDEGHLSR